MKDVYWNQTVPTALPYTQETTHYRKEEPKGSAETKDDNDGDIYYSRSVMFENQCCQLHTVWKFQDFTVIQILREIYFGESRVSKIAILQFLPFLGLLSKCYEFGVKECKNS